MNFFIATLLVVSSQAVEKPKEFVLCRNNKTVRTIRIDKSPDKGDWITLYTKGGIDKEVGRGFSLDSNLKIAGNIKKNLEGAGWRCRSVPQSTVSEASR